MRRSIVSLAVTLAVGSGGIVAAAPTQAAAHLFGPRGEHLPYGGSQHAVCSAPSAGAGHCLIHVLASEPASPERQANRLVSTPTGLPPSTIEHVYGFPTSSTSGAGETIAIVDAYNDPNAKGDLETFSKQYGLPAASLSQVSQTGGSSLPATNSGWDLEISLDIEWVHALAPAANILLVEATTNSLANLLTAEKYAGEHASWVSNSWGSSEFSGESTEDSYFSAPGVSYFAAAGDEGGKVIWPSASPDVTSVGGTSLTFTAGGTLATEEAWSGGGGGCSRYETASPFQKTGSVNCAGKRATPDFSLDANPNSGVSVYDSVTYEGQAGWWTVGGTSASTAMIAAQTAASDDALSPAFIYASPANLSFRDVTLGSNGYQALTGYDLATGLGSWSNTPGAPTGVSATKQAGGVNVAWSAPSGAGVTEYVLWRGTASGQESTEVAHIPASATSYLDTAATSANTTYYYVVQAINSAGSGPFSGQAIAAPPSVPPKASFTKSCSGAQCSFASTSTDEVGTISAFAWNGGNGRTGSASTFSDTYSGAGSYTVTLKVTNTAGQSATASGTVTCTATRARFGRTTLSCS